MKPLLLLMLCALGASWGLIACAAPPRPSNDPADVRAIKQLEIDMGDAMVAVDMERLKGVWADDWVATGPSGKSIDKAAILHRYQSRATELRAFELGPMDVQVFGDVALCQGSATETKIREGKDISGTYLWMDILRKRDGRWVVVQSIGAKVN